jgi:hypothetical protein
MQAMRKFFLKENERQIGWWSDLLTVVNAVSYQKSKSKTQVSANNIR